MLFFPDLISKNLILVDLTQTKVQNYYKSLALQKNYARFYIQFAALIYEHAHLVQYV